MRELALCEEDLDEEDAPAEEDLRWMIIVWVHMDKGFISYWFFRNARKA